MKRDILKFLCGAAAAATYGHVVYAAWTARGKISAPIWKGREWGVGKMLTEAAIYGAVSMVLAIWLGDLSPATKRRAPDATKKTL